MSPCMCTDRLGKDKGDNNSWDKIDNPSYLATIGRLFSFQKMLILSPKQMLQLSCVPVEKMLATEV